MLRFLESQPVSRAFVRQTVPFERIVKVVEDLKQEPWQRWASRYGDWGRDLTLYLARRRTGMTLRQIEKRPEGWNIRRSIPPFAVSPGGLNPTA